jgi:mRNA-degrading endonuclease RelE of RelBE toxin-antitoxin system
MASYKVTPKPSVEKDLRSLPKSAIGRVVKALERLTEEPFPRQALKLVYSVDQKIREVVIHHVRHRREVYRIL